MFCVSYCCFRGAEAILEKILGKESKPELAHVDMGARLIEAGLKQLAKHPCLWPPTLAFSVADGGLFDYVCVR